MKGQNGSWLSPNEYFATMLVSTLKKLQKLDKRVHEISRHYYNSTPVASYRVDIPGSNAPDCNFDLKDALLIAAITETPVLMTGATDTGKTTLAKLVMNALLGKEGEGWTKIDVDTDFSQESIARTNFGAIVEGKSSEELYDILPKFLVGGLVVDEMTRTDPRLAAKLLHILLEKDVAVGGKRAKIGVCAKNGTYQFQIAAINENYKGTFDLDEALRRRTIMEIPLDFFPPTMLDRSMINRAAFRDIPLAGSESHLDDILAIMEEVGRIDLSAEAEHFLLYLQAMESCVYSPTYTKGAFENRAGASLKRFCTRVGENNVSCRFLNKYEKELCPNVRGISSGVSKNLILLSRGFAALRIAKSLSVEDYKSDRADEVAENAKIETGDLMAAVPFVGFSKMGLSSEYVEKQYKTSRWHAIKGTLATAYRGFKTFYMHNSELMAAMSDPQESGVSRLMESAFQEDHFMFYSLVPFFVEAFPGVMEIPNR